MAQIEGSGLGLHITDHLVPPRANFFDKFEAQSTTRQGRILVSVCTHSRPFITMATVFVVSLQKWIIHSTSGEAFLGCNQMMIPPAWYRGTSPIKKRPPPRTPLRP